jgi:hypothetical protein
MAVAEPERKAAQAAIQRMSEQKQKVRKYTKKSIIKTGKSMDKPAEELTSTSVLPSGWKPRSQRKAECRPGPKSKGQKKRKGRRRRMNSDDLELPKGFVAVNADNIHNVETLTKARGQLAAEIVEAKRNPGTAPQRVAELEAGFQHVAQQIRLQIGDPSPPGTPRMTQEPSRPGLNTSATSIPSSASGPPPYATQAASSIDALQDSLVAKPRDGTQLHGSSWNRSRDPPGTQQTPQFHLSDSTKHTRQLPTLHKQRRDSMTQLFGEFKLQWEKSTSTKVTLVEEDLAPESKLSESRPVASKKKSIVRFSEESSHSSTTDQRDNNSGRQSSDGSSLSDLSPKEMEDLERTYYGNNKSGT